MNVPPILKNKWVWIGGGAVILVVLMLAGGSGGGSTSVVQAGPSDAEVAASRDITLAQMQLQAQQSAANASLAIATQQGQIDLAKLGMEAQLSQYALDAQAAIASLQANTSREVALADLASQERRELAQINGQTQLAKWTLDQATMNAQIQSDFQLQYAEAANATQISLAQMQAQLVNNQLIVGRDVQLAGLATQEQLAAINAALQRDVTYSNNQTQQAVYESMINGNVEMQRISAVNETERTRIMAGVEKKKSSNSLIGGIIGGVLGIFSDPRLKRNVTPLGRRPDGLGIYGYNYAWEPALSGGGPAIQHIGVMADDVAVFRPDALGGSIAGFATVDYRRLTH